MVVARRISLIKPCLHVPLGPRAFSCSASAAAPKPISRATVKRYIPTDDRSFVLSDGTLQTTRENHDFLAAYDLEHDNGTMTRFQGNRELQRVITSYGVTVAYSPKYVINPYDLHLFDPRGHPLAPKMRSEYVRKLADEPLWIITTAGGAQSAVVRMLPQRQLKGAVFKALADLGFPSGKGQNGKDLRGTLWLSLHDPTKSAKQPPEAFGRAVASNLVDMLA